MCHSDTVQKTVVIRLCSSFATLFTSQCCATTGAMVRQCCPVEVPLLQLSSVVDTPNVAQRQDLGSNCMKTLSLSTVEVFSAVFREAHHTGDELNSSQ